MAVQVSQLHQIARKTLHEACRTQENWVELLKAVAPFYKYDFEDALLISAQRPSATACATMRQWNGRNLWIRKGSKAIYTLDPNNPYAVQRVFDISDINAPPERLPPIWSLSEDMREIAFSALRTRWQTEDMPGEYDAQLYAAILEVAAEQIGDYRNDFEDARPESFMAGLDADAAEELFQTLTVNSAFTITAQRLGLPIPEDMDVEVFEDIRYFDTWATQMAIGEAAHEVAETVLRQIERAVKDIERDKIDSACPAWNNEARDGNQDQSADARQGEQPEKAAEREDRNVDEMAGDSVHGSGGRDAQPGAGTPEAAGGQRRQVRRDAAGVPPAASEGDLRTDASGGNAEAAPAGDERAGKADGRAVDRADAGDQSRARQGAATRMGAAHERPEGTGRGDRSERIDLRLGTEDQRNLAAEPSQELGSFSSPGPAQQLSLFGTPIFSLPQQMIDEILADGGNARNNRHRIVARFKKDFPLEDNAAFLRREYHTGGKGFVLNGKRFAAWWDTEGIRIAQGDTAQGEGSTLVSWEQAARRTRELLDAGRFMGQDNLDVVDHIERQELAERLWHVYRDDFRLMPEEWDASEGFPESTARIAELLAQPDTRTQIIERLVSDIAALDAVELRRKRWHDVRQLLMDMQVLDRVPLHFITQHPMAGVQERFITQDEADACLADGSGVSEGKLRIYRFYQAGHSRQERADFLKREYGTGGRSHALSGADDSLANHDSKGIVMTRGSLTNPYAKLTYSWAQVAQRIGKLIDEGRYLNEQEMAQLREMENAPEALELGTPSPASDASERAEGEFAPEIAYELGFGRLGNGTTVWNRLREENGDYKTIAHIADDGNVTLYEQDMPQEVLDRIYAQAERQEATPALEPDDSEEVIAAFAEYNFQKAAHPDHIVLVCVGNHYETYGEDANLALPILNSKRHERAIGGADSVQMTGFDPASAWPTCMMALWRKGHSVLIRGLNDQGEYETVKERIGAAYAPIGAQFTLQGCVFRVDSVDFHSGRASLQDMTMLAAGHPLFRNEDLELVHELIAEQEDLRIADFGPNGPNPDEPDFGPNGTNLGQPHFGPDGTNPGNLNLGAYGPKNVLPSAGNYHIHDDHLGEGGQRTKADRNIEAIRTLMTIEGEARSATTAEQEVLAQYVGWGGIPQIFDEDHADWSERREALKELLTPEEFASARASTLNAHYTSPTVIRAIYQGLANLGFRKGNILEPACGIGNFFGILPKEMAESKLYGVELDSVTGRIAQKLYPEAAIRIQGFEHSALPDGFFDVAVGNVPFGAYSLPDPKYDRYHFRIHDFFFAKTIDKVRPGGVVAFVTSKGTMDKQDSSVRRYIAQHADLLGAIRLPNTTFRANAGTEVTTDILFLQKRERFIEVEPDWIHVGKTEDGVPVNQYYLDHPDMLLGHMAFDKSMYGNERETTCEAYPDVNLSEQLAAAILDIHGSYEEQAIDEQAPDESRIPADPTVPNFSFAVRDGRVYFRRDHWMERCDLSAMDDNRVRGMILLRDLTRELIQAQLAGASDEGIAALQTELNERYDSFTQQHGLLSSRRNASVFGDDDGYYLLSSLEILDDEHKLERKADMFFRRTIAQNRPVEHVDGAPAALAVSMAERARVDLDFMSELSGIDKDKLIRAQDHGAWQRIHAGGVGRHLQPTRAEQGIEAQHLDLHRRDLPAVPKRVLVQLPI